MLANNFLGGSRRENWTALIAGAIGCLLLVLTWMNRAVPIPTQQWILAFLLVGCLVLADCFPIHVRYAIKLSLISVPLYLIMALLPLPLALLAAGAAILISDFIARSTRGLIMMDFIQDPARWIVIIFVSSTVVHIDTQIGISDNILLVAAAIVMFILDVASFSLFTSLRIRETFLGLVWEGLSQSYEIESIQYLIGILGALAFHQAAWSLLLLIVPIAISYKTFKNAREMNQSTRELLVNMADAIDLRDKYTGGHSRRVAEFARLILNQMNISGVESDLIITSARLHDIGKIGIRDTILLKDGPLTPEEWQEMRLHPQKGAELLGRYADFSRGYDMVLYHHEREDGKGYPRGLKGSEIPLGARVIAVADAYDAMTTNRPYRSGKTSREATQILVNGSGSQWNKEIVDALLAALKNAQTEPVDAIIQSPQEANID
jgi:hypothetical protein